MRPISAKRFIDSVGIDTHPNRLRSLWGTSDWEAAFLETGVRNVRGSDWQWTAGGGGHGAPPAPVRRWGQIVRHGCS